MSAQSLFLVTPPVTDVAAFRPVFEAALGAAAIACVHLRLGVSEAGEMRRIIQVLAPLAQGKGAAVLIDPPADLREVARLGADGVHVADVAAYPAAIEALKPDRIVGLSGVTSRHDAMTAGEANIDYLMFGEPKADGYVPPLEKVIERCTWWAEVFVTPCVGYAPTAEAVRPLADTGAEFVALGAYAFDGTGEVVVAAARALAEAERARAAAARG